MIILGSFWGRFGIILGSFWDHFGIVLGSFWDMFGIVLGSFLQHVWKKKYQKKLKFSKIARNGSRTKISGHVDKENARNFGPNPME